MRNTTKISLAACGVLLACNTIVSIVGETGVIDGCMYWRGQVVPMACIKHMGDFGAVSSAELVGCVEWNARAANQGRTMFAVSDERRENLPACMFQGGGIREYYRYDPSGKMLYTRELSCDGGCRGVSNAYDIEFSPRAVSAELVAEQKE